jgi:hypothetical protein
MKFLFPITSPSIAIHIDKFEVKATIPVASIDKTAAKRKHLQPPQFLLSAHEVSTHTKLNSKHAES